MAPSNQDPRTVAGFGQEWRRFDQSALAPAEKEQLFREYFSLITWPREAHVLDMGCGSGRWASLVAPTCAELLAVDASAEALDIARQNLAGFPNITFALSTPENLPDRRFDLIYSLGVLHHLPAPESAVRDLARRLKPGGQMLLYLYYAFDNRPAWYRALWRLSDLVRRAVAALPFALRAFVCDLIAAFIYWPMARAAKWLRLGAGWPLGVYRDRSFYTMRTDSLDRFGTRLERRFTRAQIEAMMSAAGLGEIGFSPSAPYWVACGRLPG